MAIWIPGPSFSRSIARASRDRLFPIARAMIGKPSARQLLTALGVAVPRDFRRLGAIEDLTPASLSKPTVLKPIQGSNNRGVLALLPRGNDRWHDPVHDRDLRFEQIREEMARAVVQHGVPDEWIGEELLLGPTGEAIDDVKIMAFRGRIGGAFVRRNSPKVFRWFDEEWQPRASGIRLHPEDPSIEAPADRLALTELAARISQALPLPFVRVDLYSTPDGPVAGELTPYPGWAHDLSPEMDAHFGRLYEEAETDLLARGMDWEGLVDNAELRRIIADLPARSGSR